MKEYKVYEREQKSKSQALGVIGVSVMVLSVFLLMSPVYILGLSVMLTGGGLAVYGFSNAGPGDWVEQKAIRLEEIKK